jgi:hypothetical protein
MMKEYTVRYHLGAYVYESVVKTSSSRAALLWAESLGGYNAVVMKEVELPE